MAGNLRNLLLKPIAYVAGKHAARQVAAFRKAHQHTRDTQDSLLRHMIAAHADTDFGRQHGFARLRSSDDFRRAVPVGNYETLRPFMERVAAGDTTALLPPGEDVLMFSQTSGTTGKPKLVPVTRRFLKSIRCGWNVFGLMALEAHPDAWLRGILQISSSMHEGTSPSGKPCGAISGLLAATQKRIVRRMYVTPQGAAELKDPLAKYYTIMRCGIGRDVAVITTANPSSTIKLIETAQAHTERLLRDLADGSFSPPGDVPAGMARRLRFRPDPARARAIEHAMAADGVLLPRHFWDLGFIANWTGGTLKLYMKRLKELFGEVPVRDIGLLASEGRFSVPTEDFTPAGVAEITSNYLEFLPLEQAGSSDPQPVRAEEAEVGREYFLVVTNWAGLWRYNIDDRVRIVGHVGQSPVFEFLSRGLHTASMTGEKLTEHQVVEAMRQACAETGLHVERFTLQPHFATTPYYLLTVELAEAAAAERLAAAVDAGLMALNVEYESKRSGARLGPVRAATLPLGSFDRIEREKIFARHGRGEQYKHQYLLVDVVSE